jgi:hypothetical protein
MIGQTTKASKVSPAINDIALQRGIFEQILDEFLGPYAILYATIEG